ncbi:MAG: tetratricopeptide repeat protein [Patescibacteria group bacterium]
MKLTKANKKFIRENKGFMSPDQFSLKLGVPKEAVVHYLGKSPDQIGTLSKIEEITSDFRPTSLLAILTFIKGRRAHVLLLLILCFFVYFNSLNGEMVSDDITGFKENPEIRSIPHVLANLGFWGIQQLIQSIAYNLFGTNQIPLHAISLLAHMTATVLVFIFVSILLNSKLGFVSSLLFAVFPVNSEAVAWISGLNYILTALGLIITSILFLIYKNNNKPAYLWLTGISFFLTYAVVKNPFSLTIPPIILILAVFFRKQTNLKKLILEMLPIAVVSTLILILMLGRIQGRLTFMEELDKETPSKGPSYLMGLPYITSTYIELYLMPLNLSLLHEETFISLSGYIYMIVISIVFLITFIILIIKKKRIEAGLLLIILSSLLPSFSPVRVAWFVAERYMYVGSMALMTLYAYLLSKLDTKTKNKDIGNFIIVLLVCLFSIRTAIRNYDWSTQKRLWVATERTNPNSPKVHINLGDIYMRGGDLDKALTEFNKALVLRPNYSDAAHNIGTVYLAKKDYDNAQKYFALSLKFDPNMYLSHYKNGVIEYRKGNLDNARKEMYQVLEKDPSFEPAKNILISIEKEQKNQSP